MNDIRWMTKTNSELLKPSLDCDFSKRLGIVVQPDVRMFCPQIASIVSGISFLLIMGSVPFF